MSLNEKEIKQLKEKLDAGYFPQWVVTDPDIYKMEMDKIFTKTWQFLAHESELDKPGSYVTRWIVYDPILLTKNKAGEIKNELRSSLVEFSQTCLSLVHFMEQGDIYTTT